MAAVKWIYSGPRNAAFSKLEVDIEVSSFVSTQPAEIRCSGVERTMDMDFTRGVGHGRYVGHWTWTLPGVLDMGVTRNITH